MVERFNESGQFQPTLLDVISRLQGISQECADSGCLGITALEIITHLQQYQDQSEIQVATYAAPGKEVAFDEESAKCARALVGLINSVDQRYVRASVRATQELKEGIKSPFGIQLHFFRPDREEDVTIVVGGLKDHLIGLQNATSVHDILYHLRQLHAADYLIPGQKNGELVERKPHEIIKQIIAAHEASKMPVNQKNFLRLQNALDQVSGVYDIQEKVYRLLIMAFFKKQQT